MQLSPSVGIELDAEVDEVDGEETKTLANAGLAVSHISGRLMSHLESTDAL